MIKINHLRSFCTNFWLHGLSTITNGVYTRLKWRKQLSEMFGARNDNGWLQCGEVVVSDAELLRLETQRSSTLQPLTARARTRHVHARDESVTVAAVVQRYGDGVALIVRTCSVLYTRQTRRAACMQCYRRSQINCSCWSPVALLKLSRLPRNNVF